ncbi:DUF397 domain-containing protein [Nonomuraea africana]|uniref:DUF397 domain-containing protein n=1 Tax=Nonomuraea africana TaxID=46171 RepID=A0ABR9KC18_9ACTN|nr:DUF397 domain-containing protein [Nonomuraea africana]MBE1559548.1 hypothetical protein [Nonomuraea africana]
MKDPDFSRAQWRKSTFSADGACVEVAYAEGAIGVRDTKQDGAGPILVFDEREWAAFLRGVQAGQFEIDELTA